MARGRKADSAEVKRAKGNPGKRAIPEAAQHELPEAADKAPRELSAEARKIWNAAAPHLQRLKFLRQSDVGAFARYCEHLSRWWTLTRRIRRKGETYKTRSRHGEMLRVNPDFLVREKIEGRLESLEDRFGLSPRARQEILAKLAAQPPVPPGGLWGGERASDETVADEAARAEPRSAVGLLGRHVH